MNYLNRSEQLILFKLKDGDRMIDFKKRTHKSYGFFLLKLQDLIQKGILIRKGNNYYFTKFGNEARNVVKCLND